MRVSALPSASQWAQDRPREFDLVSAQAQVAACEGRVREARELYRRAIEEVSDGISVEARIYYPKTSPPPPLG